MTLKNIFEANRPARVILPAAAFVIYLFGYLLIPSQAIEAAPIIAVLPVVAVGWALGLQAGLYASMVCIFLNTILLNLAGRPGWDVLFRTEGGLLGTVALAIVGATSGLLSVLQGKLEKALSEHTRLEETLRESDERYRLLVENANDIIYKTDINGIFTFVNPVAVRVMGYSKKDLIGNNYLDLIRPDWRQDAERLYRLQFAEKIPNTYYEFPVVTKGGEELWMGQNVQLVMEDDLIVGTQSVTRDITERKRLVETLRESEERYRAIFEQAADSVLLIDAESGDLVEFNDLACENLGYTREEFEKLKIQDFDVYEIAEEVEKHIEKILKEGSDSFETKHKTKEGEIRDIQVSSRAISARGKAYVQSICRDITEQKRAIVEQQKLVEKIQNQTVQLQGILDTFQEGILALVTNGPNGRITVANSAASRYLEDLTDIKEGEMLSHLGGRPLQEFFKPNSDGYPHLIILDGPPQQIFEIYVNATFISPHGGGWTFHIHDVTKTRQIQ